MPGLFFILRVTSVFKNRPQDQKICGPGDQNDPPPRDLNETANYREKEESIPKVAMFASMESHQWVICLPTAASAAAAPEAPQQEMDLPNTSTAVAAAPAALEAHQLMVVPPSSAQEEAQLEESGSGDPVGSAPKEGVHLLGSGTGQFRVLLEDISFGLCLDT